MKCGWAQFCAGNLDCAELCVHSVSCLAALFPALLPLIWLLQFFCPLFNAPPALGVQDDIDAPIRTWNARIICSQSTDQLWVSAVNLTCCKRKCLWGRLRAALSGCWLYSGWCRVLSLLLGRASAMAVPSPLCSSRVLSCSGLRTALHR